METLQLREFEALPVKNTRATGDMALSRSHAERLRKMEKLLPGKAFSWEYNRVRFGHFCGVITLGDLVIEILPKIYGLETDTGASRGALIRMLARARRLRLHRTGSALLGFQRHFLLDIFVINFCEQLRAQLLQGLVRRYIERNENLPVLRGRLIIEQQVKHNLVHKERLYCRYDELSENNIYNQVIKRTLALLVKLPLGNEARKQVTELCLHFDHVDDWKVDINAIKQLTFDRTIVRYQPVFEQCRWFLSGMNPDVFSGDKMSISLLFDMNRLFEAYVGNTLRKIAWMLGLKVQEQRPQRYFVSRVDTGKDLFLMKPDISILDQENRILALADAKWKVLDDRENKLGISQADLYQVQSYATRYGATTVVLIYPLQERLKSVVVFRAGGSNTQIIIQPFDVLNPEQQEFAFINQAYGHEHIT